MSRPAGVRPGGAPTPRLRRFAGRVGLRQRNVLVVDTAVPTPDRDAGSRTMSQVLALFRRAGFKVHFWSRANIDAYEEPLAALGIATYRLDSEPSLPRFASWLAREGARIDAVFLSRPRIAAATLPTIRRHVAAPVLYYGHDIFHQRFAAQALQTGDAEAAAEAAALQATETAIWSAVDTVFYPTAEEVREVEAHGRAAGVAVTARVLPVFGYDTFPDPAALTPAGRAGLVFVGGFRHAPNVDAMLWFVGSVWPRVADAAPGTRLTIIGSHPPEAVSALARDRIDVRGFVPDDALAEAYRTARVAIAPLRFGAGMKGKIAEAMRHGVPVVTTAVGAQGFEGAEEALAVADGPEALGDGIVRLLADDALWTVRARAGVAYARARFSQAAMWAAIAARL